jgi:Tfp pilus assembly protein PilF
MSDPSSSSKRWRYLTVCLVVLVALDLAFWAFLGGRRLWAWQELRAGRTALEADDFDSARAHLATSLRLWPSSAEAHLLAARAARRADDLEDADHHLGEHERLNGPAEPRALEWAMLQAQRGELRVSEQYLLRVAGHPEDPATLLVLEALAKAYYHTGQEPAAVKVLDDVLRRQPNHFTAHLLRAEIAARSAHDNDAIPNYDAAVALRPGSFVARLGQAGCLDRLGRLPEALADYELLRSSQPDNVEVLLPLAKLRTDSHELDQADAVLDHLLAVHPNHPGALIERARVALRRGEARRAEEVAAKATELAPHDSDAWRVLMLAQEAQGETEKAKQSRTRKGEIEADNILLMHLNERVRAAPENLSLRCEMCTVLLRLGRTDEAVRGLEVVLHGDPNNHRAHTLLADYYERTGQADKAALHRQP